MAALAGPLPALLVGCSDAKRQQPRGKARPLREGELALNGWIKVAADGSVTAVLGKSEMGQGVHTALLMLVAEELDCAWSRIAAEHGPVDKLYGNVAGLAEGVPFRPDDGGVLARSVRWTMHLTMRELGFMMTGGSSSLRDLWRPLREAAALTRATLVQAAASAWGVPADRLSVADSAISGPDGKRMDFGEAVKRLGPNPQPAASFTLKDPARYTRIGKPTLRPDARDRVTGRTTFGIDVMRPGMLYAALKLSPVLGGSIRSFDGTKARARPGVKAVLSFPPLAGSSAGVAVVADRWWTAKQALDDVTVDWDGGAAAALSSVSAMNQLAAALDGNTGFGFWKLGDVDAALAAAPTQLQAEYRAPYLAHAPLEPMNCTVHYHHEHAAGRATVWVPTQVAGFARRAAAKALDLDEDRVELIVTQLGGGFGRRLESDVVAQAATIARQMPGATIQVIWSREEDMRHDFYRPACVARFAAGLDARGRVAAWRNVSAGQSIVAGYMPRNAGLPAAGPDKSSSEGAYDVAYEFPAVRVGHVAVDLPVPVGFWRGVGHSHQAFFKEGFLDECAHAAKADPLAYRLALLARHPREKAVLELAAAKAGWGQPLGPAADGAPRARGVALHESFGSVVAQVAEVSIVGVGAQRRIRVHRVVCAIECGLAVNPNGITQQIESSVIFGLSAALYGRIDIEGGRVLQSNFHDYPPLRYADSPAIETHIVAGGAQPEGVGEPGVPPIAPAVANAVFVLTGQRLRSLPLALAA